MLKKASYIILILFLLVLLILCALPALFGAMNSGGIIIFILVLLMLLFFAVRKTEIYKNNKILRKSDMSIIILIAIFAFIMAIVSAVMIIGVDQLDSISNAKTVIVPGCKVNKDVPSRMLKSRLDAAYEILNSNRESICIVSGGQGSDEEYTEAYVMKKYLVGKGILDERIFIEEKSVNTRENFIFSAEIIKQNKLSSYVVICTDFFHEYRCSLYAKKSGLSPKAYPAKTQSELVAAYWIREIFAVVKAFIGF